MDESAAPWARRPARVRQTVDRPLAGILVSGIALITGLIVAVVVTIGQFRQQALADSERELGNIALVLAEGTDRSFQSLELVEEDVIAWIASLGITSNEDYDRRLSGLDAHEMLIHKMSGLPQVEALTLVDAKGNLVNFSRAWPVPARNMADREHFQALASDAALDSFLSGPIETRSSGQRVLYLAHKIRNPDGEFLGLVVGALRLEYFENLFASLSLGARSSIAWRRNDGTLLARYPHIGTGDQPAYKKLTTTLDIGRRGSVRKISRLTGQDILLAAHRSARYPLMVVVGRDVAAAYADARHETLVVIAGGVLLTLMLGAALFFTAKAWRDRHDLDLVERRRVEEERNRNREFLDAVIDNVPVTIVVKDARELKYLLINKAGEAFYGLPRADMLGRTARQMFPAAAAEMIEAHNRAALEQRCARACEEEPIETPGGRTRIARRIEVPICGNDGAPQYLLVVIDDVTERSAMRRQLEHAQKMEAVGNLTGGLAHDFNNLLLIVIGNLELLEREMGGSPAAAESIKAMMEASRRGAELTRELLAFSRQQSLTPQRIEVNELVGRTMAMLRRVLRENIRVELRPAEDAWPVFLDETQLEHALINIAINARDAMPGGGVLTVVTENLHLDAVPGSPVPPGDYVTIEVGDTGTGIEPEVLPRIFEPFFTTKAPGMGTGLGLSMVYGYVQQSGGTVVAASEPGRGTRIKLYLPRAAAGMSSSARESEPRAEAPPGRGEVILAVDDNAGVRAMVRRHLLDLGYRVFAAEEAGSALDLLASVPVDLLFTDIVMPGPLNGRELADTARRQQPGLRVLFTSGFPLRSGEGGADAPFADHACLAKPYRMHELACAIRAALDTPAAPARH